MDKDKNLDRLVKLLFVLSLLSLLSIAQAFAGIIKGKVVDAETGETLINATITYAEGKGVSTDIDGMYSLDIPNGKRTLTIRYIGYKTIVREVVVRNGVEVMDFALEADNATLQDVTVLGETRQNTEFAIVREQQQAHVSMVSVSDQHIRRTQDKDASEVIRRIPGVSIIDEKFVMVRGLSQRYNNVWMNGAAVASSEADQRAFSFDIIPSSQIFMCLCDNPDNLQGCHIFYCMIIDVDYG